MILVACAVIHNFNCINNPNGQLLQQYNLDGHTVREVKPWPSRNDGDNDVPTGIVAPNLVVGQDIMSRVRDDMINHMFAAFQ